MAGTLADEIIAIVKSEANNIPPPQRCTISKIYEDRTHCDIMTSMGKLKYIDVIGSDIKEGNNAIILFLDENYGDYVVIADSNLTNDYYTKNQIDKIVEDIISGQIDLTAYMKWTDYTNDLGDQTDNSEFLRALDNTIIAITGRGDL